MYVVTTIAEYEVIRFRWVVTKSEKLVGKAGWTKVSPEGIDELQGNWVQSKA